FVASLPAVVSDGVSSILPFLIPYKEFMVSYMRGFVEALTTTFGMGTNGYLMVVIFAYIGGLIAEQTRRELVYRSGSGASVGVDLVQPLLGARGAKMTRTRSLVDHPHVRRTSAAKRRNARFNDSSNGPCGITIIRSSERAMFLSHAPLA